MSKLLIVFGATGQQGGSVITSVINDPELSKQYKMRAITRDPSSKSSKEIEAKGIEVVQADADDQESLRQALQGAHTVVGITVSVYDEDFKTKEVAQGKAIVDAAVAVGAEYFIWSTTPMVSAVSGGKYKDCATFDTKAEVEAYLRSQPIKSAFFAPGSYMQNVKSTWLPRALDDGTYAIFHIVAPQTTIPLIEIASDTGKYVSAMLADPAKYEGKVFSAASEIWAIEDIASAIGRACGKTVKYMQVPEADFRSRLPLHPPVVTSLVEMMLFIQDFAYYGPETKEKVQWTAENARGKLTSFEDYLVANPISLQ
ncbi:NmrA family transcriptional regulator [Coleophoma crateriformis]|uniref:NmrA family transcriptional regulator n=1 Tax=Coleophoma crateriformis TaxID=565419 RepID=A0A3D8T1C4_9HELO|nr:NmrA family transcriptional regulator [Coleophoma crateriformis]